MLNFIVNSRSGKGLGNRVLKILCDYCYEHNLPFSAHITGSPGHATDIARLLCSGGAETIIAVGGDGTFNEVLCGIDDFSKTALGFIPAGRGNDYARAANLSLKPLVALKAILKGERVSADYLLVSGKRCLNVAGSGLDVAVLKRAYGKNGKITYLKSLLYCLKNFTPYKFNIEVDGVMSEHECIMVGACNGVSIGAGIKISPLSNVMDGKMNAVVIRVPENNKLLSALMVTQKGKHLGKSYVTHIECEHMRAAPVEGAHYPIQIDGEIFEDLVLDCRIIKGGMRTFIV